MTDESRRELNILYNRYKEAMQNRKKESARKIYENISKLKEKMK